MTAVRKRKMEERRLNYAGYIRPRLAFRTYAREVTGVGKPVVFSQVIFPPDPNNHLPIIGKGKAAVRVDCYL
jgi:hypothetical protein